MLKNMSVFMVALLVTIGCGGSSSTGPTSVAVAAGSPTASTVVLAPPPAGVSPEVWRVGFFPDELRRSADFVRVTLPANASPQAVVVWEEEATRVSEIGCVPISVVTTGGNFTVEMVIGLTCAGGAAAGCTSPRYDTTGRITGGTVKIGGPQGMEYRPLVAHELWTTIGLVSRPPDSKKGVTSSPPWGSPEPSSEERAMIQGWCTVPRLAKYSAG